jgi:hypothetical protein
MPPYKPSRGETSVQHHSHYRINQEIFPTEELTSAQTYQHSRTPWQQQKPERTGTPGAEKPALIMELKQCFIEISGAKLKSKHF